MDSNLLTLDMPFAFVATIVTRVLVVVYGLHFGLYSLTERFSKGVMMVVGIWNLMMWSRECFYG